MSAATPLERAPRTIRLPELSEERTPGARVIKRAVTLLFAILGLLMLAVAIVSALVTAEMTIDANGVLEARRVWPVRSQEPGTVVDVFVATGDTVAEGQLLVRLDTLQLAGALAELRSTLEASRIDRDRSVAARVLERHRIGESSRRAEAEHIRAHAVLRQRLVEHGMSANADSIMRSYRVGTHAAIDLAVAAMLLAESDVRGAAAEHELLTVSGLELEKQRAAAAGLTSQIARLEERIDRLSIRAPATGVVLTEQLERISGVLIREGEMLLEVADVGGWRATLYVKERDIRNVHIGDPVMIDVLAFPRDREFLRGTVILTGDQPLGRVANSDGPADVYWIIAAIEMDSARVNPQDELRQGYTVRGKIIYRSGRIATLIWRRLMQR